ncbi:MULTISPECIES: OmpA family protein [Roseobacteraceae]|jgi:outer membrane protein OmpA-like peptidoglycan-associated protein|uniref:OmpA family protein n=1 Tax=Celeribacter baekdonensis B30 TaxID=1208323 RepID=K2J4L0_9RHOB|nr:MULTISPECIES: OmpA family protein [Roseobacteraceae]EKE69822.1 OmpA family protein [Celeribacter baekdonensis B30]KAB6717624.1 OmpA family protein [Roseobacter sp. TSBP12]|tara:strand:+ start:2801 stop:3466 length:666 start_codon:yes stop_codon:yes gene_type:complete
MRSTVKLTLAGSALLAFAACTDQKVFSSWYQEAGGYVDNGTFGNSTMNNTLVQTGQLSYVIDLNERFAAEVPTTVNFEFNSAILDGAARDAIRKQARYMAQFPEVRFRVYGHTDLVGSDSYNKSLGLRRAKAVVAELARNGISRSRLEAMVSYGETQPLIVTQDPERKNRRTVTEVSGFVENAKLVMDSRYAEIIHREYIESATAPSELVDFGAREIDPGQ